MTEAPPVAAGRGFDTPVVTLDGRDAPPDVLAVLRTVRVEESIYLPDSFELRFDDPHFVLFDGESFRLGTRVSIAVRADGAPQQVTEGEVTAISVEPGLTGRHELVVTGLDRTHRLAKEVKTRTFQKMSDASIVSKIAREYGLDADVSSAGEAYPYLIQAGCTDLAFLRERAARTGHDVWITGKTLHFRPRPEAKLAPPTLTYGENLTSFRVRFSSAERCDEVTVSGWDPMEKVVVTATATAADGDPGCTAPAAKDMSDAARAAFGRVTRRTGRHSASSQDEAKALATSLMLRASGSEVTLRGEALGDPRIAAGATVTLAHVGTKLAGKYRITTVQHLLDPGQGYRTRFTCGAKDPASLVDLVPSGPAATASGGSATVGAGLISATVSNTEDPEKLGRVKVRFPTLSTQDESGWARVASPGAGKEQGLQWTPEVGDEVLVGFESGDPNQPVVLGGLWNRKDKPPQSSTTQGGKTTLRTLTSRSGHHVTIVDDPDPKIVLEVKGEGSILTLSKDATSLEGPQKVEVKGKDVEVTASGTLTLKGSSVKISAQGEVSVSGATIKLN